MFDVAARRSESIDELGGEPVQVRIESFDRFVEYLLQRQPLDAGELLFAEPCDGFRGRADEVPKRNIGVLAGAAGVSDGKEERLFAGDRGGGGLDAEFLLALSLDRVPRKFAGFDMPARRQPETGFAMLDQHHLRPSLVEDHEIAHQMHRWRRRFGGATERCAARNPCLSDGDVTLFQIVPGADVPEEAGKTSTTGLVWRRGCFGDCHAGNDATRLRHSRVFRGRDPGMCRGQFERVLAPPSLGSLLGRMPLLGLGEPVGLGAGLDDGAVEGEPVDDRGAEPGIGEGPGRESPEKWTPELPRP
jgi:hypothetical protein